MNNEENNKKTWQTPEIVDLDVEGTLSGPSFTTTEITPQYAPSLS
jgi:hypothetical protein